MEMVFKCGLTEIEYRAALGLRQNPLNLYYQLDHDGSKGQLDAPDRLLNASVRRELHLDNIWSSNPSWVNFYQELWLDSRCRSDRQVDRPTDRPGQTDTKAMTDRRR